MTAVNSEPSGCRDCVNAYKNYDGPQCRLEPHSNPNRYMPVIRWLQRCYAMGDVSWTAPGCPEFRSWR